MIDKIIDDVITPFRECPDYPNEEQRKYYEEGYERIEWLKSLKQKFHWKPSEEQMQHLHKQSIDVSVTFPEDVRVLTTLYEDLQKLLEE